MHPTDYGAFYSAKRKWDDEGNYWHRISQFIFPFHTMIAASVQDSVHLRSFIPLDDHYCMLISQQGQPQALVHGRGPRAARDSFSLAGGFMDRNSDPRSRYFTKATRTTITCVTTSRRRRRSSAASSSPATCRTAP